MEDIYEESIFPTQLWTDGACSGNPGKGGAGAIIRYLSGEVKELSFYEEKSTNQRMEIKAVIIGLEEILSNSELKSRYISVFSDSAYVCNCMNNKWYEKWRVNGWKNSKKENIANKDLWEALLDRLDQIARRGLIIEFVKVKGHSNNLWNERVDKLAVSAYSQHL